MHGDAPFMAPIEQCGALLRNNPNAQLASAPLKQRFPPGSPATILRNILNSSVKPVRLWPPSRNLVSGPSRPTQACGMAEYYFLQLMEALQPRMQPGCEFFMDGDVPLFLRKPKHKTYGACSALSLARFTINGVLFPSYSLVRLEAADDTFTSRNNPAVCPTGILKRSVGEVATVGFMRVSTLAIPQHMRDEQFIASGLMPDEEHFTRSHARQLFASILKAV